MGGRKVLVCAFGICLDSPCGLFCPEFAFVSACNLLLLEGNKP